MSGTPPTTLGKYQIIREIARSNDIVYEAYDPLMNRRVAIKELAVPGGSTSQQKEDRIKRFLREARAAGSLAHPNIMTVYEVGQEGDRYFIAMEYLDGKTLRNELDTKGFLPPERATEIGKAVLEGLEYAHTKGVIHRDIKPDNIQLLSNGGIKLTDFGIARLTFEPNLTMDGQVFGTPSYMSPEQVVGRDIDARSDLFSVGVVLYEMLSGSKPFPGDSVVTITYSIMNRNPDRPQQINWALWQVVEKALDKSPQLRYRSAREFIESIDAAMSTSSTGVMNAPNQPPQQTFNQPPPQQLYPSAAYVSAYGNPQQPQQPAANNPYAHPLYVQPPYVPGGQLQGPVSVPPAYGQPVPVYYPPPPRKPLFVLNPQVKRLLAQTIIYLMLFGAAAGLVVEGLQAWFDSYIRLQQNAASQVGRPAPRKRAAPQPAADPADQWNDRGLVAENSNDYDEAERDFRTAISVSPKNPDSYLNLGELLATKSQMTGNDYDRRSFLMFAADAFATSSQLEKDPLARDHANIRAAQSWYNLAQMYSDDGEPRQARDVLYKALQHAHSDPKLETTIQNFLDKLSGSG